jgi:hypothetical protein
MRITDVGGTARGEQPSDVGCVNPVERDDVGPRLPDQSRKPDLTFGSEDGLSKCRRWDGDRGARFISACKKYKHATISAI